ELMAWADVAVTASGSTCWELLYMGLPSAVIVLAENQEPIARDLSERGAVINLGWQHDLSDEQIGAALRDLIEDEARRKRMSETGRALVDGRGAERVIWAMEAAEIDLRPAQESDCRMIWEWANDPGTRANSFSSDPIPWETHVRWFENQLRDATKMLLIASQGERGAIGQVRFAIDAPEATISVAVDSQWRGQGYGSKLIFRASQRVFQTTSVQLIYAYIKTDNPASRRAFAQAGYVDQGETTVAGHPAWIMILAREL
ncbi:MAG TPA: GNAT family N-acetyltransferase, partial [Aggregatilineaceae bacterium]|nr:GNAT family N-acetyltransferase [Aggregatilineaceae bacterium]